MAKYTEEDIKLVNHVDEWAQENNKSVDSKFHKLYSYSKYTDEGWESIAKDEHIFSQALALAKQWEDHTKGWVTDL